MTKPILVTAALPYANGSIHLGHMVEYIQADVFVRFLKMTGEDVVFVCADDTHGTPIMLAAQAAGLSPEEFVQRWHEEHLRDFTDFGVEFDSYYTTNSEENRRHAYRIFEALAEGGYLEKRDVEQLYCPNDEMFLPDRFVRGTCPKCGAEDQYGDSCEVCGAAYSPMDLVEPKCAHCGAAPVPRTSAHWFVRLSRFKDFLEEWTRTKGRLQTYVLNYVDRWIQDGLKDWDITRDAPYFGFPVPGEEGLFLYVWMDAPIGYIASTEDYCRRTGRSLDEFWAPGGARILHIIGKDIIYFHTLFWPAMLHVAGYNLPDAVYAHGFLTVEGRKMSKSRGTFIRARTYLDHLDPTYLRYYFASKLSSQVEDIDLSFEELVNRVNAELVNKVVNLASRSIQFLTKRLGGELGPAPEDAQALLDKVPGVVERVASHYRNRDFSKAIKEIVSLAEEGNLYLQEAAPWVAIKTDQDLARGICSVGVNLSKVLAVLLAPVIPGYAKALGGMLGLGALVWSDAVCDLWEGKIARFDRLMERLDAKAVQAMVEASAREFATPEPTYDYEVEPLEPEITIDTLMKADLRVARVVEAKPVKGAKKLLQLTLSLGPLGTRNVFAGIAKSFSPEELVGLNLVCVANLKPRKMMGSMSEGMIMATGPDASSLKLVTLPEDARPGDRIH